MNFNVYIEKSVGEKLVALAHELGMSRNAIIREAISGWVDEHQPSQWPESVKKHKGEARFPRLENYRSELLALKEEDLF